jgi:hypothetical protein
MTKPLYVYGLAICLLAACSSSAQSTQQPGASTAQQVPKGTNVNPDAGMVGDFKKRVDEYVKIREKAEKAAPVDLQEKSKPAEIVVAEKTLGQRVRTLRAGAKQGDVLTPATQAMFRRLLRPPLTKGSEGADNKAIIKDDAPAPKEVPFKVNAEYPKEAPLSTVPPDVLLTLPALPEDMQYRFVGKHLVLFDSKANVIVDFMLNAIP